MVSISSRKHNVIDIFVIFLITLTATLLADTFHVKGVISMLMFFLTPAIYLLLRHRNFNIFKIFLTTIITGITAGALDAAITANMGWWIPIDRLVFPVRFLGIWNIDNTLWYMGLIFYIITFYEYFLDTEKTKKLPKKFPYLALFPIIISLALIFFRTIFPDILSSVRYPYLLLPIPFIITPIILLYVYGRKNILGLLKKFFIISTFFFIVNLIHEIVALRQNQWTFPGEYIGVIHFAGVVMPFEELFMYVTIFAPVILMYYEIFVDDTE